MGRCLQNSLSDGKCQNGGWDEDTQTADTVEYGVDEQGYCIVDDDPCPGDNCANFQPDWGNCSRCGEPEEDCHCENSDAVCGTCGEERDMCTCYEDEEE